MSFICIKKKKLMCHNFIAGIRIPLSYINNSLGQDDNQNNAMNHFREPGFYEASYICRNTNGYYQNFNVTVQYNKRITPEMLSHALRNMILQNQNLYTNFFRKADTSAKDDETYNGRNFQARPVKEILFSNIVSFQPIPGDFNDSYLEGISYYLPLMNTEDPLWRVIVFESPQKQFVTFYCDHALFDGTAGTQFHRDLISELAKELEHDYVLELLFLYPDDCYLLPKSMNGALEYTVDIFERPLWLKIYIFLKNSVFGLLYSKLLMFLGKTSIMSFAPLFKYKPVKNNKGYKYKIINFNNVQMAELRKVCANEGVSITSYIGTVGIYSLQRTVFAKIPDMAKASSLLKISVNGRRFYPNEILKLKYGVCVATFFEPLNYIEDIYDVARLTNTKTKQNILTKSLFWTHGDSLKRNNFWNFYGNLIGNYHRDTLYTSNLGIINIKEKSWEGVDIWFSQSNGLMSHFVFSVASTPKGGMNICLGYLPEYEQLKNDNDSIMNEFTNHFKKTSLGK